MTREEIEKLVERYRLLANNNSHILQVLGKKLVEVYNSLGHNAEINQELSGGYGESLDGGITWTIARCSIGCRECEGYFVVDISTEDNSIKVYDFMKKQCKWW